MWQWAWVADELLWSRAHGYLQPLAPSMVHTACVSRGRVQGPCVASPSGVWKWVLEPLPLVRLSGRARPAPAPLPVLPEFPYGTAFKGIFCFCCLSCFLPPLSFTVTSVELGEHSISSGWAQGPTLTLVPGQGSGSRGCTGGGLGAVLCLWDCWSLSGRPPSPPALLQAAPPCLALGWPSSPTEGAGGPGAGRERGGPGSVGFVSGQTRLLNPDFP